MTTSFEPSSADAIRSETAADWLQRLSDERMSEDDVQAWLQWYGASDANRRTFEDGQSLYVRLRGMNPRQRATLRALMPEEGGAGRHRFDWRRHRGLWAAAASFAIAALLAGAWLLINSEPQTQAYVAPIDHYRAVPLADGSDMVLSASAAANVSYTRKARSLEVLQGAAYFRVKHDPRRPFVVHAGEVSITAVGTAFSVRREADKLSVTVTEGSVDVVQGSTSSQKGAASTLNRLRVKTGERTQIAVERVTLPSPPSRPDVAGPWQDGSMQFFNMPLGKVVEAVNAQASHPILIEDPRVTDLNYSGTVFRERIDEWVAALPQLYPVRSVPLADGAVTLILRSGE